MKEMRKTYHAPKTRLVVPPGMYLMDGEQLSGDPIVVGSNTYPGGDVPIGPDVIDDGGNIGAKSFGGSHFE